MLGTNSAALRAAGCTLRGAGGPLGQEHERHDHKEQIEKGGREQRQKHAIRGKPLHQARASATNPVTQGATLLKSENRRITKARGRVIVRGRSTITGIPRRPPVFPSMESRNSRASRRD